MSLLDYDGLDYHTGKFKTWVKKLLEGKSNAGHKHTKSDITDFPTSMPANGGNSATVNNHTVETDVPIDAVFTDTVYDDTEVKESIEELNSNLDGLEFGEQCGGKNIFNQSVIDKNNPDVKGAYAGYRINANNQYTISITEKDSGIDISGIFFGVTKNGYGSEDGYEWLIANGSLMRNSLTVDSSYGFISFYKENGNLVGAVENILQRFNIQIEYGEQTTTYEPYIPSVKMLAEENARQNDSLSSLGKCKNLLKPTLQTTTQNGVTCTANGDGTYTLNGTNTGANYIYFQLCEFTDFAKKMTNKELKLVGCPTGGGASTFKVQYEINNTPANGGGYDFGNGVIVKNDKITSENITRAAVYIIVRSGATLFNKVFKPMLTTNLDATYNDFVPYTGDGDTLTSDVAKINSDLGGKANSSHTHTKSQITDFPTSMPANGGNSTTVNGHTVNSDVPANAKFTDTTYNIATTTANGLMSKEHVSKLNNIQIKTYTSIESLGLSGTPTVNEIKLAMPLYSELLIEVNFLASKTDSEGNTLDNASCRIVKLNSDGRAWAEAHGKSDGKHYVMRLGKSDAPNDFTEVWEQIAMDSDIKSHLALFGTSAYGRGLITDALNVDLTSAEGNANKVGYVSKGSTTNLPTSVEWGIREVFYYNESNVIVKITGWDNQVSQITSWYNIYSSGSWVGWTKQLTDKGGQMNGELKLSYGSSIANGAYVPSSTTVESLCNEISKSSGCSGSVSLVKCTWNNVVIPAGWYNYLYIPHRTGGKNGAENGDNHQYGTLLLFGMTSSIFSQCFRVAWQGNKVANIEMILSASDGFSDTLLASRTGRLYVYSNTKGDVVTTNGKSAISATGAKSIIIKGTLGLPDSEPGNLYGGHMIISVEGKGSWLDNDANDNWGLAEDPLTYITPCGNTVYIYHMAGSWAYDGYPTSFVTLANGEQYSITDSCGFFGVNHTENNYRYFKLMLSIADTVLFNSSYNSLQNVNIRQLSEGVKSLYPSRATNSNITLGSNSLHYFIANSGTAYRPEDGCILHAAWNNTNGWDKQLMLGDSRLWYRSQSDGTWGDWVRVADSKYGLNYNGSYNLISHNTSTQTMYSSGATNETGLIGTNIGNTTYNTRINSNWYMYLYSTGKISTNQNISTASDEKVKDFSNNLETDYDSLIKIFDIIQPKSYKYKYSKLNSESIGFCAQEVEDAFKSENIDTSKYSVLNIQYNYMMSRGDTEEDFKYYTKFMEISYNDLYNLSILKIKDMEEKHTSKLENLEARLSALENKEA